MPWGWNGDVDKPPFSGNDAEQVSHQNVLLSVFRYWQRLMAFKNDREPAANGTRPLTRHSIAAGTQAALQKLCTTSLGELPGAVLAFTETVDVTSTPGKGDEVYFPTPLREQEATAAIKALEACAAAAIAKIRYGTETNKIQVDTDKVSAFLMSAYLTTLDGIDKPDPRIKGRIPGEYPFSNQQPTGREGETTGLTPIRHGLKPGSIRPLPPNVGQPIQHQESQ
jgi:hypothetical protein